MKALSKAVVKGKGPEYKARIAEINQEIETQKQQAHLRHIYIQDYYVECTPTKCLNCTTFICSCSHERCIYPRRGLRLIDRCHTCFCENLTQQSVQNLYCETCIVHITCPH